MKMENKCNKCEQSPCTCILPTPKKVTKRPAKRTKKAIAEEKQSKGLGDTIAKVTNFLGIKPCPKCEERRLKLNKAFPYTKQANIISDEDMEFILSIKNNTSLTGEENQKMADVVMRVFGQKYCLTCPAMVKQMHEKLQIQARYQQLENDENLQEKSNSSKED